MANLGYTSKLQIVIVPSGQTYTSPTGTEMTGKLIFREADNIIEVNGHEYQASSTSDLSAVIDGLKNTGYLTESGGVLSATQNLSTVADLLGDKIKVSGPTGTATVSDWITSLQGNISSIETDITNLQNLTATGASSTFVERSKGDGHTDYANTDAIAGAIANAKTEITTATSAAAGNVNYVRVEKSTNGNDTYTISSTKALEDSIASAQANAISGAKEQIIGTGAVSGSTNVLNPNEGDNNVWLKDEEQTLTHIKSLINTITGGSDLDLDKIQQAIAAIKTELKDGSETGELANTLIDKLSGFLNNQTEWTVNGATGVANVQGIITQLEAEISSAASTAAAAHSTVGATGSYITVTSATGAGGGQDYTVASTTALSNAISNAKTTVGATGSYVTVTKTDGTGATPDSYQVSTTAALNTAIENAKTTINEATSAQAGTVNYVRVEKSTSGNDTYTIQSTKALEDSIASAQSNAENTAKGYADNVISWTVIGAS